MYGNAARRRAVFGGGSAGVDGGNLGRGTGSSCSCELFRGVVRGGVDRTGSTATDEQLPNKLGLYGSMK